MITQVLNLISNSLCPDAAQVYHTRRRAWFHKPESLIRHKYCNNVSVGLQIGQCGLMNFIHHFEP